MSWHPKSRTPPSGYDYGPDYRITLPVILRAVVYILVARPRSLGRDAGLAVHTAPSPPLIRGLDLVPEEGKLVIAANHYERPGLWMAWPALIVSGAIRQRTGRAVHWIAIQEWESFSLAGFEIPRDWIRRAFERAFATYGILAMAPEDASAAARATSMRAAVHELRAGHALGLMPEGTVGPTPELLPAREGAGAFMLLLGSSGARILPAGIYEQAGRLVVQFGEPFELKPPRDIAREARDRWASDRVMGAIRDLLPQALWGAYAQEVP
jgi:1-acyl-sn-glycerol-3-phosphate acyltransferase